MIYRFLVSLNSSDAHLLSGLCSPLRFPLIGVIMVNRRTSMMAGLCTPR